MSQLLSKCTSCGAEYPSAPAGTPHKCGNCPGGFCKPIERTVVWPEAPAETPSPMHELLIRRRAATSKRFYMGVVIFMARYPTKVENYIERFCGWAVSEDAARGAWVKHTLDKHKGKPGGIDSAFVDDITDHIERRSE